MHDTVSISIAIMIIMINAIIPAGSDSFFGGSVGTGVIGTDSIMHSYPNLSAV